MTIPSRSEIGVREGIFFFVAMVLTGTYIGTGHDVL